MGPIRKAEARVLEASRTQPASPADSGHAPASVALPDPFPLYRGGILHGARIAYESWGQLNAARDNAILLFTGLSPSAHAAATAENPAPGWWQRMIGPALAIDTSRYFVLCVNSLGSCFGSTGPASINPATGERYRLDFPEVAVEDIARSGYEAARALGIEQLEVVMGASLGGTVVASLRGLVPARRPAPDQHFRIARGLAVCDRTALGAARSDPARPGLAGRQLPPGAAAAQWHATGAQARHHHLPLRDRVAPALRARAAGGQRAAGESVRATFCGRRLSRGPGRTLCPGLRCQLLPVPVAGHGPVRPGGTRRFLSRRTQRQPAGGRDW